MRYLIALMSGVFGLLALIFGSHMLFKVLSSGDDYSVFENAIGPSPKPELFAGVVVAGGLLLLLLGGITFRLERKQGKTD